MVPVILKLVGELLDPEQAAVFVSRPDGRLAAAGATKARDAADGLAAPPWAVIERRDQNRGNSYFRR